MDPVAIVPDAPNPPPVPAYGLRFPYLGLNINPTYNASLNFSSLLSMIPGSKLLKRLRRSTSFTLFDEASHVQVGLGTDLSGFSTTEAETANMVEAWATQVDQMAQAAGVAQQPLQQPQLGSQPARTSLPLFSGPWEFFTSGYIVGLFIMAVLLHRMQNLIIPSPHSRRNRPRRAYRSPMHHHTGHSRSFRTWSILWERLHSQILPLDFSKTTTRFIIHIPSSYYLLKMLVVWTVLVLQTTEALPTLAALEQSTTWILPSALKAVLVWALRMDMAQICWSTFCAVCGAYLVEGFIKSLYALSAGSAALGPNGLNGMTPFHLVSYAFLLHIYSVPVSHGFHPTDNSPSRPDKHVVITITIALLQLSMFHLLSISKHLSNHRLIPTAIASILSLIHFHTTLISQYSNTPTTIPSSPTSTIPAPTPSASPNPSSFASGAQRLKHPYIFANGTSYPLLNYVPNVIETILLSTIILTIGLNAAAQLLVRGRIDRLFSGLGLGGLSDDHDNVTLRGIIVNLPYEEDFIIVLLRAGIASLEATGLRGWANEVAPITRLRVKSRRRRIQHGAFASGRDVETREDAYGRVTINRLGAGDVEYGVTASAVASSISTVRNRMSIAGSLPPPPKVTVSLRQGFANEVRHIDLGNSGPDGARGGRQAASWRLIIAAWQFLVVLGGVIRGLCMLLWDRIRRRAERADQRAVDGLDESDEILEGDDSRVTPPDWWQERKRRVEAERDAELYQRFLRGEDISDDEEDLATSGGEITHLDQHFDDHSDVDDEDAEDSEENEDTRDAETLGLLTDLLRGSRYSTPAPEEPAGRLSSSGQIALAHFAHGQTSAIDPSLSPGPLTRRQWNALRLPETTSTSPDHHMSTNIRRQGHMQHLPPFAEVIEDEDHAAFEQRDKEIALQHVCVICMLDAREIICWPCRCLSMCDGCRETLASRGSASKHRCPCCRQIVEGYSKIYIP